ncbi:TRAP transporter small permease [Agathobaculum sp.]|uniref:TRAP transporter small permease n=1 Tax=Agathobaculum sp. TaxID=2048138 RepID=UPI002A838D49|nr:TRAP transporter small permease [Agathobaculum sp.]MDY3618485.1 TRAP transporter small permease [Agathobaculum sp.]
MNKKEEQSFFKKFLGDWEMYIASVGFVVMCLAIIVNVFSRFVLRKSFAWAEEVSYFGFVYAVFFGVCTLYKNQAMIAIDVIVDRLPKAARRVIHIFNFTVLAIGNAFFTYYSYILTVQAWVRPTAALRIPYSFMDVAALISFFVMTLYSLRFLYWSIKGKEIEEASLEERA